MGTRDSLTHALHTALWIFLAGAALLAAVALTRPGAAIAQAGPPNLVSPADGTVGTAANYPPLGIPDFAWSRVPDATKYRLQFSRDIGFATVDHEITTPLTRYTPTSASTFSDGTWYWRVRVESPAPPGAYGDVWSFTKQWASADNAPQLTSPDDGATLAFYDRPAFSWDPVPGAAYYRFQVAASPSGFGDPLLDETTLAPTLQPTAKRANGSYYWRVVPVDGGSHEGTPSQVRQFTSRYDQVPGLLQPADGAQPSFTPTFRWTAVRGAQTYELEYSTDPTFQSGVTAVEARNTTYTPRNALPNDVNYYWRVRANSGSSVSDWSNAAGTPWSFVKRWNFQPRLLTPTNLAQQVRYPFFSWTPVPAASRYRIEVAPSSTFPPVGGFTEYTANPWYVRPSWDWTDHPKWYWRVTPEDHRSGLGLPSAVFSFDYDGGALAPQLIYPLYYYSPEDGGLEYLELLHPREDRSVALPVFSWHRLLTANSVPNAEVAAYRIRVDDDPLFGSPDWTFDTQNLNAAPTLAAPFAPVAGTDYYWRVWPLDGMGGAEIGYPSQRWRTRFDPTRALPPTTGPAPALLRPAPALEAVETTPLLEWWSLQGADAYDVQISADPLDFAATIVLSDTVPLSAYSPPVRLGTGTYYWRVRGRSAGLPLGGWSEPWRFQVAAQSRWRLDRTPGNPANRLAIGSDPAGDMADPAYDLTGLYATQAADHWYFGLSVSTTLTTTRAYALYLDLDHAAGSGATSDPRGYHVDTLPAHRPEVAIYLVPPDGAFSAASTYVYAWTGGAWGIPDTLQAIGGVLYAEPGYVEIEVPNAAIGMEDETGSAAISLWSALSPGGHAQDTVPTDPQVAYTLPDDGPETTTLTRFSSVSNQVTLALPATSATGDPALYPSVPPLSWHMPVDTPWVGFNLQVALDEQFTAPVVDYTVKSGSYVAPVYTHAEDLSGDNSYFWRVRSVHTSTPLRGSWSRPARFERAGFSPLNLASSVDFSTPSFSWDWTEGARTYDLQMDNDPSFGSPEVSANDTGQNSYTPLDTVEQGSYFWRVRADRHDGIVNDWTAPQPFVLSLPQPAGLSHEPPGVVERAPSLCWTPVLTPSLGDPVLAAWKYRVQVSKGDPTFSTIYDSKDTEQACWTPTEGYADQANFYWRVALIDGGGRLGSYGPALAFTKQYPITALVAPPNGSVQTKTPTFAWTAVDGAATYRLEVSLYPNFGTLYDSVTTSNIHYTPVKLYDAGTVIYWRVAIRDKDNNYGPFTDARLVIDPYPFDLFLPSLVRSP